MKIENFSIPDSVAIDFQGCYLDLHNNYDFSGLTYEVDSQRVTLKWSKSDGEWAEKEVYSGLSLVFDSVSVFSVSPRASEQPFSEDNCLSYIGFLHPDDIDLMDGFLPPENAGDTYHLVFGFDSGQVVKLYAEVVSLLVTSDREISI